MFPRRTQGTWQNTDTVRGIDASQPHLLSQDVNSPLAELSAEILMNSIGMIRDPTAIKDDSTLASDIQPPPLLNSKWYEE
jgi:hypothetical protein